VGLAALVVALSSLVCLSQEHTELGESGDVVPPGEEGLVTPHVETPGPRERLEGLANSWAKSITNQAAYNQRMRKKITLPRVPDGPVTYSKIPWFALKAKAQTHQKFSFSDCELECNKYNACKSFSYNLQKRVCITSTQGMGYDPDYTYSAKKQGGADTAEYLSFAGMKFQVSAQVIRRGGTYAQCEYMCTQEREGCSGFSFGKSGKVCMRTSEPLMYDAHFNYYEKTGVSSSAHREKTERNELALKKNERKHWETTYRKKVKDEKKQFHRAVANKEAEERFVKEAEHEEELSKNRVRESNQKLAIAKSKKRRFEAMAKAKDKDEALLAARDRLDHQQKEVAEKRGLRDQNDDGAEAADAKAEEDAKDADEEEVAGEEATNQAEVAEIKSEEDAAAKEETKDEVAAEEAQRKEQADAAKTEDAKLKLKIAEVEARLLTAKRSEQAKKAMIKEAKTKEKKAKAEAVKFQMAAEKRSKSCFQETDAMLRKELCQKSKEDEKAAKADAAEEETSLEMEEDGDGNAQRAIKLAKADKKLLKTLKEKLAAVVEKQRHAALMRERSEKAEIKKENQKKRAEFNERKQKLAADQEEDKATQALEVKSKMAEIEDMKADMAAKQKREQQNAENERINKQFNAAVRASLKEKANKKAEEGRGAY
jgi:hypothetical protein